MMPSAPWNGTVRTLRNTASDRHISGMLHEISEVFVGRKAEARRRAIDHGVHRIRERPPPRRNRDDDENLDGFLGQRDAEQRMQGLRQRGVFEAADIAANGARATPSSEMLAAPRRNAVQTLAGGPGRSSAAITSHKISSAGATAAVPMTVGRDSRTFIGMANMPLFRVIYRSKRLRPHVAGSCRTSRFPTEPAQQPLQIFFSRAFMSASSAPIVSTYLAVSTFETGARCCFAAADDAAGGVALS